MKEINGGWWVPSDDDYFGTFIPADTNYKQNGFQREHLLKAFEFVKKWDYAVDVGAHVGFWAKDMADRFKHVYCFEPSPATYACLLKNMEGYNNVVMSPIALGQRKGFCDIARDHRRPGNTGSEFVAINRKGSITMQPLDAMDLGGCDLLKIDVEGGEYHVLLGAQEVIHKYRPVVIMECDKHFAGRFGVRDQAASEYLVNGLLYREVARIRPDRIFVPAERRK